MSLTVIEKEHVSPFPELSITAKLNTVVPTGNTSPDEYPVVSICDGVIEPRQLSVATIGR